MANTIYILSANMVMQSRYCMLTVFCILVNYVSLRISADYYQTRSCNTAETDGNVIDFFFFCKNQTHRTWTLIWMKTQRMTKVITGTCM